MKKIIAALVVLAIAAPAMATDVTAVQIDGNSVQISYDASGDPELVRAFGIDITLDTDDVNFVDISDTSADYPIFPGSIDIDIDGNVSNYGTPVGSLGDHPDTQPGLDSNGVTIEMGSLYASGEDPPEAIGDLVVLKLGDAEKDPVIPAVFNLSMADNTARGGIVLEGGCSGSSYGSLPVYYSTLTLAEYTTWLAWGGGDPAAAPQNWRGWCWKCGDVDANGAITANDVIVVFGYLQSGDTTGRGDADMNGAMTANDVIVTWNKLQSGNGCGACQ